MQKYSKDKLKLKRWLKLLIIILVLLLVISAVFLSIVGFKNNIVFEKVDSSAAYISDDETKQSTPILVNNLLLGAVYNKKWVSSEKYYLKNDIKSNIEIDIYNSNGKAGKFLINSMEKDPNTNLVYAKTTNTNVIDEYFAVSTGEDNIMSVSANKILNINESDIEIVKKGLGIKRIFNTSIKINSVYEAKVEEGGYSNIYIVTNQAGKSNGAYSAIIYKGPNGKIKCIKYSYVKDINNASDWPVYSFKFAADLNRDGTNELIIQETKEFEVKYDVLEYRNNKFYGVLSSTLKTN